MNLSYNFFIYRSR